MCNSLSKLAETIDQAAHYLPSQGPMSAFVHHNTLHVFEDQPFEQAVIEGGKIFGCEPYMTEDRYQSEFRRGRITEQDIEAVLIDDLGDEADQLVTTLGTRYALRLAMLRNPLRTAPALELRWLMTETDIGTSSSDSVRRRAVTTTSSNWEPADAPPSCATATEAEPKERRLAAMAPANKLIPLL